MFRAGQDRSKTYVSRSPGKRSRRSPAPSARCVRGTINPAPSPPACRETEGLWNGRLSRRLPPEIQRSAARKLEMLNAAGELDSLWIPPCNRLERLRGDRAGQYSIRINEQWWISEIVQGRRAISADTALRLGRFFGMEAQLWLNLQSRYDLLQAEAALAGRLEREVAAHAVVVNARGLEGER